MTRSALTQQLEFYFLSLLIDCRRTRVEAGRPVMRLDCNNQLGDDSGVDQVDSRRRGKK